MITDHIRWCLNDYYCVITLSVLPPLGPVLYSLGVTPWRILMLNIA